MIHELDTVVLTRDIGEYGLKKEILGQWYIATVMALPLKLNLLRPKARQLRYLRSKIRTSAL